MDILNKPITSFTFQDVVSFCKQGYREGFQLDYKRDLPKDGLAKYFAAFSNTRGGALIVGVEEDKKSGVPIAWNGIINDAKTIEKIYQWVSNIEPMPLLEVYPTDEVGGKIFIVIRIFEGDRPPYYVQNDPKIYIRTGNITPSIDLASPDAITLFFEKKEKANLARQNNLRRSIEVFSAGLKRAEIDRKKKIAIEKENYLKKIERGEVPKDQPLHSNYISEPLNSNTAMLAIHIQPFYPNRIIVPPKTIKNSSDDYRVKNYYYGDYPTLNLEAIPDGVFSFEWGERNGQIDCDQLFSDGMLFTSLDVLRINNDTKERIIYISSIASRLYIFLQCARKFYEKFNYQGELIGKITLTNTDNSRLQRIVPDGWHSPFDYLGNTNLLSEYEWDLDIDTSILNNPKGFQDMLINKIKEVYWSVGYEDVSDDLLKAFLKQLGWNVV